MAITKKAGRQEVISATVSYVLADLVNGVATSAIVLPPNARILNVYNKIGTAFNSGTTDALVVQSNESTPKTYISITAALNALSAGLTTVASITNIAFINPVRSTLDIRWTGTGTAATTGTGTLIVEYVVENRSAFAQD